MELKEIVLEKFSEEKLFANFCDKINTIWEYNEADDIGVEFE